MSTTGEMYFKDVFRWAHELNVHVRPHNAFDAFSQGVTVGRVSSAYRPGSREVVLTDSPTTPAGYAVAMHELGHAATFDGGERRNHLADLHEERKAWQWARKNALHWTEEMMTEALRAYQTYVDMALECDFCGKQRVPPLWEGFQEGAK